MAMGGGVTLSGSGVVAGAAGGSVAMVTLSGSGVVAGAAGGSVAMGGVVTLMSGSGVVAGAAGGLVTISGGMTSSGSGVGLVSSDWEGHSDLKSAQPESKSNNYLLTWLHSRTFVLSLLSFMQ